MKEERKTEELLVINKEDPLKALGVLWNHKEDLLQYNVKKVKAGPITKRSILSAIAQVYDPLGLLGPIIIIAKIIMQQLWTLELNWDESLPQELHTKWQTYQSSWNQIGNLRIHRPIKQRGSTSRIDIQGFSDASERAYGACLYAISRDSAGNLQSQLLCAKSRVAPLRVLTIAKLELCAALLLAKLYKTVQDALGERINNVQLWSDSTIVLGWIHTCPSSLKTFVANRVSQIQTLGLQGSWKHVPSAQNPADILSKGATIDELQNNKLWWHGPGWLLEEGSWPEQLISVKELPERRAVTGLVVTNPPSGILPSVSSFSRLLRIIAYCYRLLNRGPSRAKHGVLTVDEIEQAETAVARVVQGEAFPYELHCLQNGKPIKQNTITIALDPYIDDKGLIRVGGRLQQAALTQGTKHPVLLPSKHHVTRLLLEEEHKRLHHCGAEQLRTSVRQKYWILSGRREARKVTRSCVSCFRWKPISAQVKMGSLPAPRVTGYVRPFAISGVDYAGPIKIRESRRRGRMHTSKAYVALFICFNTKAVHLELVTDLTTECFMAALRRFTGRRGNCQQLYSDNATNFVGAARELEQIYDFLRKGEQEIRTELASQRIEWHFIPPRAPNFGGLWESNIKSMKRHFYVVTKGLVLTFEECYTLLIGIEAVLNSRPLTAISSDVRDLTVLTPSHFLIGERLSQPVEKEYREVPDNKLKRWQHLQKVRQDFWRRWQREYLAELQRRTKWTSGEKNLQPGSLVLLKEDNLPPLQWAIGRITDVYPGSDNIVRVVGVQTAGGTFKRPARNVCPLPITDNI